MAATHGNTTTVSWNGQSLGYVTAIGDVSLTADQHDVSTYNATDGFKSYLVGLKDGAEISITCNFDVSDTNGQVAFGTDFYAGTSRTLLITFPTATGATWTMTCLPTGMGTAQPINDKISMTIAVKPTGKPVLGFTASNNVSALTVTTATLYPTFAAGTYDYVGTCAAASLTMTPTFAAGTCSIYNGTTTITTLTTIASSAIALGANGSRTVITMTVTETNKTPKVYTFDIARTA